MEAIYIQMVLVFTLYLTLITVKYGILTSLSDSHYQLKQGYKYLFVVWSCTIGASFIYLTYGSWLGFLGGLGMWIVATIPAFKQKYFGKIAHYIGAGMSFLSAYGLMYVDKYILLSSISMIIQVMLIITYKKNKNYLWWMELTVFTTIFIYLFHVIFL